jgi:hypothetical protein
MNPIKRTLRYSLFWVVTQRMFVFIYRRSEILRCVKIKKGEEDIIYTVADA